MSNQRPPAVRSRPVLWWELITEMEDLRAKHGLGMANVWGLVHRGDYDRARAEFDRVRTDVERMSNQ